MSHFSLIIISKEVSVDSIKDIIDHLITLVGCHDLIVSKVHQQKWNVHVGFFNDPLPESSNLVKFP